MSDSRGELHVPFLPKNVQAYDSLFLSLHVGDTELTETVAAALRLAAGGRGDAARALLDATREFLPRLAQPALALYSDSDNPYQGTIHLVLPPNALAPSRRLVFYPTRGEPLTLGEIWTSMRPACGPLDMGAFANSYAIQVGSDEAELRRAFVDVLSKRGVRPGDAFLPPVDKQL